MASTKVSTTGHVIYLFLVEDDEDRGFFHFQDLINIDRKIHMTAEEMETLGHALLLHASKIRLFRSRNKPGSVGDDQRKETT